MRKKSNIPTKYTNNSEISNTPINPGGKKSVKAQKQFILDFLGENQANFERVMNECMEKDPKTWLKIMLSLQLHVVPQDKNVNVNVGINKDFLELQAMGRTKVSSLPSDDGSDITQLPNYTQYEEIISEE